MCKTARIVEARFKFERTRTKRKPSRKNLPISLRFEADRVQRGSIERHGQLALLAHERREPHGAPLELDLHIGARGRQRLGLMKLRGAGHPTKKLPPGATSTVTSMCAPVMLTAREVAATTVAAPFALAMPAKRSAGSKAPKLHIASLAECEAWGPWPCARC